MASRIWGWSSAARMRPVFTRSRDWLLESLYSARLVCVCALTNVIPRRRDAIHRVLNLYPIICQSRAGSALQLNFRLLVRRVGVHQIEFSYCQVALRGERLEARSRAQFLLLLHDVESLLGEVACLSRGLHAGLALFQRVLRIANLDANLLLELLLAKLRLAILQLRAVLVGLGHTIVDGNIQVQSYEVVRGCAVVGVFEGAPETRRQRRHVAAAESRIQLAR